MIGPASNAILVVLAGGYVWRLWTHRHQRARENDPIWIEFDGIRQFAIDDHQIGYLADCLPHGLAGRVAAAPASPLAGHAAASSCSSGARMGVAIDVEQPRRVDRGVDLGRRQAGVAEQFLQRAQGRRRAPANGSRSCGAARAESGCRAGPAACAPRAPPAAPDRRSAARRARRRTAARRRSAETGIAGHSRRSPRATAGTIGTTRRLRPFAGDPDRRSDRQHARGQRQRLGDPQPGAVEQQQDGEVARPDPLDRGARGGVVRPAPSHPRARPGAAGSAAASGARVRGSCAVCPSCSAA